MNQIQIKHQTYYGVRLKNQYVIYLNNTQIGEISFIKKNKVLIIGFLGIYKEQRNKGYGYMVVEYLLSHYKVNCIVGQTLQQSRTFWNKCIKRFNGQRRNIYTLDNCTSSFVIPKWDIPDDKLYTLLDLGYEIE